MKKKWVLLLIVGVLLVSDLLSESSNTSVPSIDQVTEINLRSAHTSWRGYFYPNGSARLVYGTGIPGVGVAPEGSFSFEEIYNLLIPHLKQDFDRMTVKWPVSVGVYTENQVTVQSWRLIPELYPKDKEIMETLMYGLRDKVVHDDNAISDRQLFEKAIKEAPLIPGDDLIGRNKKSSNAARQGSTVDNDKTQVSSPSRETVQPDTTENETPVEPTAGQAPVIEEGGSAGTPTPTGHLWLYVGIPSTLCVGAVLWFIHRKRR